MSELQIYGVDKNPLAVDLCKVALWIESHAPGKPLTFLDHRIRCGDSLVGIADLSVLEAGIPDEAFKPVGNDDKRAARAARERNRLELGHVGTLFSQTIQSEMNKLRQAYRELDKLPDDTPEQVRLKALAYQKLQDQGSLWWQRQTACHLWVAAFFQAYRAGSGSIITTDSVRGYLQHRAVDGRIVGKAWEIALEKRFFHWTLEFAEVFAAGGFDVVLGNPPFMGGLRISGNFGEPYRKWLEFAFNPFGGTADLCAAFFRQAFSLLKPGGRLGMLATNTLGQGDTRESGLAVILKQGGQIGFAQRFVKWPGQASVEVNLVALTRLSSPSGRGAGGEGMLPSPSGKRAGGEGMLPPSRSLVLDSHPVPFISSRLDDQPEREPARLKQNEGKAFQGDIVRGIGFVLAPDEAERLLAQDPRHADCLFPYLNGEDLNSHPEQQPSRWVICFHDWLLERARQYPELLKIVEERVKPERERLTGPGDKRNREFWWQFGAYRAGMRTAIAPLRRVLVGCIVTEHWAPAFVPNSYLFAHRVVVFAFADEYHYALIQSSLHDIWTRRFSSTLESRLNYSPTDCFDTFPFPPAEYATPNLEALLIQPPFAQAAQVGGAYHEHRRQVMLARQLGLTKTYNLFHNPACQDADIARLHQLHAEMDRAILACYGWQDLDLRHDFYQNERGQTRFMPSAEARRELIARLMELNERMAREER